MKLHAPEPEPKGKWKQTMRVNLRSELARLRRLAEARVEAARPKEIFLNVTVREGVPLTAGQERALAYNRSLKSPERVGFAVVLIRQQLPPARRSGDSRVAALLRRSRQVTAYEPTSS